MKFQLASGLHVVGVVLGLALAGGVCAQERASTRGAAPPEGSAVPRLVKFGDALRDAQGAPRRGVVGVTFAIYSEREGGAALWQETQNVALDADGRYSVLLGAASRDGMPAELFDTGEARWLGVRVNVAGDAEASAEQARVLLVSVPYALHAADAETLGGRAATEFVLREELAGWSGAAAGVVPGPTDRPRAVGGAQGVVNATGAVNFMPRVTAIDTPLAGDVTYGNSQIFDDGTNIRIGNPAVGTALVTIELTTPNSRNAFNSTLRFENTAPITGSIVSAMNLTLADRTQASNESKQAARFTYLRNVIATGGVTNFDSILTTTAFINSNAPYVLRGVNMEFPRVAAGMTLNTYYGLFLEAPLGGGGTITNAFALVTAPGSGNVGIGTTTPAYLLDVAGNARVTGALRAGQYLDLAGNPIGGAGTITGVTAGTGLTGGGTSGGVTLNFDTAFGDGRYARLAAANSFTGNQTFTGAPTGTAVDQGSLFVNPATAGAGNTLLGVALGGNQRFRVDADGNVTMTGANGGWSLLFNATSPNIFAGSGGNSISAAVVGAVIAGGGATSCPFFVGPAPNRVTDDFGVVGGGCANQAGDGAGTTSDRNNATVSGGINNTASGLQAAIGGGNINTASGPASTVGGGSQNTASGFIATIGGGQINTASADYTTIAGGVSNTASNYAATVPGGESNAAAGLYSFAAGRRAKANHDGAFVWGDSTDADVASSVNNEFVVRATGGVHFRNAGSNIFTIDGNGNVTASGSISGAGTVSSFTATPTGSGIGQGSLFVNPATAPADNTLFGIAVGGSLRFRVDAEGDALFGGTIQSSGFAVFSASVPNILAGHSTNAVNPGVIGAVISGGGGGSSDCPGIVPGSNTVTDDHGTVSGGCGNRAGDAAGFTSDRFGATVGGGLGNVASGEHSTIAGGRGNTADGQMSTVGGGNFNTANGQLATVGGGGGNNASFDGATVGGGTLNTATDVASTVAGGYQNNVSGLYGTIGGGINNLSQQVASTVPGGELNFASGSYSFAAGRRAKANHQGAFVWGDSTDADIASAAANEFLVRASGGAEFTASDAVVRVRNINDQIGGFVGDSFAALQLGMYNPDVSAHNGLAAGQRRVVLAIEPNGKVGSVTNNFATSLAYRNILDDGNGAASISRGITANNGAGNNAGTFVKGSSSPGSLAAVQVENTTTSGEGMLIFQRNSGNPNAAVKLIVANGSTADYLKCEESGVQVCHISNAGSFVAGSDFAEALPAIGERSSYEPGDVLVMARDGRGVEPTREPYSPRVAGVYSTRPAVLGAEKGGGVTRVDPQDVPVAIVGIVPTKVSAENGPIAVGDLLVTSSTANHAMRGTERARMFGAVVGKALEPFTPPLGPDGKPVAGATGVIRVLVTLQ